MAVRPARRRATRSAWKFLMDPDCFCRPVRPDDGRAARPDVPVDRRCCWWSGQSWPYATTQTLKAMANLLHDYEQDVVTKADYFKLLQTYALTHRKDGRPYIAEACQPGHRLVGRATTRYNHSEHYFHSAYSDLVITGLVGLRPRDDDTLEVNPLAPDDWDYFALDDVAYRGHRVGDRLGPRRHALRPRARGCTCSPTARSIAASPKLGPARRRSCPPRSRRAGRRRAPVNFAVNNDGDVLTRASARRPRPRSTPPSQARSTATTGITSNPPNRWTCEGSPQRSRLGRDRLRRRAADPHGQAVPPRRRGGASSRRPSSTSNTGTARQWTPVPGQTRTPGDAGRPPGERRSASRARRRKSSGPCFTHARRRPGRADGVRGLGRREPAPSTPPPHAGRQPRLQPRRQAVPQGVRVLHLAASTRSRRPTTGTSTSSPEPHNRWTSYESPNARPTGSQIDFGAGEDSRPGRAGDLRRPRRRPAAGGVRRPVLGRAGRGATRRAGKKSPTAAGRRPVQRGPLRAR